MPKAVEDMLREYGPLWFTVDENASVHASIVIGLLQTENELYVSYIDPYDGQEYDEPYNHFHNRYEEPARQFNLNPKYMEAFLKGEFYPVHVVHYDKQSSNAVKSSGLRQYIPPGHDSTRQRKARAFCPS